MIIGRKREQQILRECIESQSPEFVAVYGRRRIGKTFLIKQYFKGKFDFYMTGSYNSTLSQQLGDFQAQLEEYSGRQWAKPKNWREAFRQLKEYLSALKKQRVIVFIDELPWLDTPRSQFIGALELFWNSWGDSQNRLKFIVCGSATTWMTGKLLGDKGGLHNRVTRRIYLAPFTLGETEMMLRSRGVMWNRHQIVECYMAMGGTPFYLSKIDKSLSLPQNIDQMLFSATGELRTEYDTLFRSLFKESAIYRRVVELLAKKTMGLTRSEILSSLRLADGGSFSEVLHNLITCDFIREYSAFGKKHRDKFYQLTDLFTLFYLKQVKDCQGDGGDYWTTSIDSPAHRAWTGYAFEQVCLHHIPQIKAALGISGIHATVSSWIGEKDGKRIGQIDLLIDRRDEVVNVCEMKYSISPYAITPAYLTHCIERMNLFREATHTTKALHLTFITISGLKHNEQWGMVQNEVTADALFAQTD
ncbi:MAG: ATP-binding protein [Muribaculaceae bacterium]